MIELLNWFAEDGRRLLGALIFMVVFAWCVAFIIAAFQKREL